MECELSQNSTSSLDLTITPIDPESNAGYIDADGRLAAAVDWSLSASRQARALLERDRQIHIHIPSKVDAWPTVRDPNSAPPLGRLIRPLFSSFVPVAELKDYQRSGVRWLLDNPRCILADDMGLGKTVQVIEALRDQIHSGGLRTALVLCPRTLGATWESELRRWAPELSIAISTAWNGSVSSLWQLIHNRVHVLVLHYDALKSLGGQTLNASPIELLVLDEAHRVRRSEASLTGLVRQIRAESIWAMTGTPIERDTEDLATLLSILDPSRYTADLHNLGNDAIRAIARPLLLRRERSDVLLDLPAVSEVSHPIELSGEQREAYVSRLRESHGGTSSSSGELLALIGDLLTICDADPVTQASSKLNDIAERLFMVARTNEKAIVFSYKLNPLGILANRLEAEGIGYLRLDGSMDNDQREATIDSFRSDPSVVALIASSRVASEGLTLTEANHVFFVNRWWNPSSNEQARDRVVRIGQDRPVTVHTYVCTETLEERLEEILDTKSDIVDNVVNALSQPQGHLDQYTVTQLLTDA